MVRLGVHGIKFFWYHPEAAVVDGGVGQRDPHVAHARKALRAGKVRLVVGEVPVRQPKVLPNALAAFLLRRV